MTDAPLGDAAAVEIDEHDPVFVLHEGGKIEVTPTAPLATNEDLARAYTPGVARVSEHIHANPDAVFDYTWRGHTVAVITDGTAVLGLGDIGPAASLPVMEGKAALFKEFGGVDAVPIALDCTDTDEIVETVVRLAPSFGGINLEDISAPRCFEIERRLQQELDIPVFHDDQHGTAIVVAAALTNAFTVTDRQVIDSRVVISGAGAAGVAVARILYEAGVGEIVVVDRRGAIHRGRDGGLPNHKEELTDFTNPDGRSGSLEEVLRGADAFIGVSGGSVPESAIAGMAPRAIVFGLANPTPEVHPDIARRHAEVVATGRSDFPNQINNVLAFPGIFRGALAVRARAITEPMKIAAAAALARMAEPTLSAEQIIPSALDRRVAPTVAAAVAEAARRDGVARR